MLIAKSLFSWVSRLLQKEILRFHAWERSRGSREQGSLLSADLPASSQCQHPTLCLLSLSQTGSALLWVNPRGSAQAWLWHFLEVSEKQLKHCVNLHYHFFGICRMIPGQRWEENSSVPQGWLLGSPYCAQCRPRRPLLSSTCCRSGFLYIDKSFTYLLIFLDQGFCSVTRTWSTFVSLGHFSSSHDASFILQLHMLLKLFSALPASGA